MKTVIRNSYTPKTGDYCETIVVDKETENAYIFDCDGIFTPMPQPVDVEDILRRAAEYTDETVAPINEKLDTIEEGAQVNAIEHILRNGTELTITNKTVNVTVPTKTSDLTNDGSDGTDTYVESATLDDYYTKSETDTQIGYETTAREIADSGLQEQIDAIVASSDVVDVVGTYAALQAYDTSGLSDNDIIKVLTDETRDDATTYYRWDADTSTWGYIGAEGPFYTKAESDALFTPMTRTINGKALSSDITLTAADVHALPDSTVIPTVNDATLTIQKNGATVQTFTANQSTNATANIVVPTDTSDLNNDGDGQSPFATEDYVDTYGGKIDTIEVNGVEQAIVNKTVDITVPTKTSDLTNDGSDGIDTYVEAGDLATVATTGDYDDLLNKPTIPTVNDATLTIQKNGTDVATFTANSSTNQTANITVPTDTSDLTNGAGFITTAALSNYYTKSETYSQQEVNSLINTLSIPTKTSDLTNDGSDGTSTYVETDDLATVATTGDYDDLINKPVIPTYSDFTGATSSTAGAHGLVPAPAAGDQNKFLQGDGTWATPADEIYSAGNGINIDANNEISVDTTVVATQTDLSGKQDTLTAGDAIDITNDVISVEVDSALSVSSTNPVQNSVVAAALNGKADTGDLPTKTSDLTNDGSDGTSTYVEADDLATVATSGSYNDLLNKPTIGNATLTIQKNGTAVDTFTANATSNKTINITVPTAAADVSALPDSTKYAASISMSINTTDYKVTTTLKDQDGNTLGTAQVIDLPLESVVVNGSYDNVNKKIVLTLQNGNTVDIPVGDLVSGLQTEITSSNKLASDLVDDTNQTNKFMTSAEKTKLAGIATGAEVNVQSDWNVTDNTSDAFIKNKPTIPTVNNGTLTIQKNGTTVQTFTANQSGNATANITVPVVDSSLSDTSTNAVENKAVTTKINQLDRYYRSLVPVGTAITANKNLNTVEFLKVGKYYCSTNATVATLTNCPTGTAFMMEVFSPLSTTIDNETTGTWVYRMRLITELDGDMWYQGCNSNGTPNNWTYGVWRRIANIGDVDVKPNSYWGTSSTAAATAAKVVTVASAQNFKLVPGAMVTFKAPNTNTAQNPTINVNSTGAKPIFFNSAVVTTSNLNRAGQNGRPATYVYDGTNWVWASWSADDDTTYSTMSVAEGTTGTATNARTVRADYLKQIIEYYNPTVNNGTLTIQKNGTTVNTFTANSSNNVTANIPVPTLSTTDTDPGEGSALAADTFLGVYDIAPTAIDGSRITNGTVTTNKLASNAVTAAKVDFSTFGVAATVNGPSSTTSKSNGATWASTDMYTGSVTLAAGTYLVVVTGSSVAFSAGGEQEWFNITIDSTIVMTGSLAWFTGSVVGGNGVGIATIGTSGTHTVAYQLGAQGNRTCTLYSGSKIQFVRIG